MDRNFVRSCEGASDFSSSSSMADISASTNRISESNIGFKLLKKSGWTEGTGLGAAEQGRLNPIEGHLKLDKRGIGAPKKKNKINQINPKQPVVQEDAATKKKKKRLKRLEKIVEAMNERTREQELARDFFREFWPDNV